MGWVLEMDVSNPHFLSPCQWIDFLFSKADSVGGELYYSAGASVISDIPAKPHWPVKAHLWVNAGRLDSINQSETALDFVLLRQRAYESFQFAVFFKMSRRVLENNRLRFSLFSINFRRPGTNI